MAGQIQEKDIKIGIIGGTGLENSNLLDDFIEHDMDTPYGKPSAKLIEGEIKGVACVLLARHGKKHDISPSNVPFRANLWAMKKLGVNMVLATNACGSLREEIRPGSFVFFDDYMDRTTKRAQTFYDGVDGHPKGVCHIPMYPACSESLRKILIETAQNLDFECHDKGTIVCIEGPRYSSRAESNAFRQLGADIINMTVCPEVMLTKELGMLYAGVALITDYDCWKDNEKHVTVDVVAKTMVTNAEKSLQLFAHAIEKIGENKATLFDDIQAAKVGFTQQDQSRLYDLRQMIARSAVMIDQDEVLDHLL